METKFTLERIELEVPCPVCNGVGEPEAIEIFGPRCSKCYGAGYVPTKFGEKVLALMRHNFRPMLRDATDE